MRVAAVTPRPVTPPDDVDVARLLDAADGPLGVWLRLAATTGARRGEICGLQWHDLDLDTGALVIRRAVSYTPASGLVVTATKTGAKGHRVVALDVPTSRLLARHRAERAEHLLGLGLAWRDDWWVFSHRLGETSWRPDYVTHAFGVLRGDLGLEHVRLHDLRHYVATTLLADGEAPVTVAGRLGHATAATTLRRYAHFVPATDRAAADSLARRLAQHGNDGG